MALYDRQAVRDNCGFGLIAHLSGEASHRLVRTAITSLARMTHRGGIAADGRTGDGCGLLLQKPDGFFQAVAGAEGWTLGGRYGVGMVFLSQETAKAEAARTIIDEELERETLSVRRLAAGAGRPGGARRLRPADHAADRPGPVQRPLRLGLEGPGAAALHGEAAGGEKGDGRPRFLHRQPLQPGHRL